MKQLLTFFLLFLFSFHTSLAQNQKEIDSLEKVLSSYNQNDTIKVDLLNHLGFLHRKGELDKGKEYLNNAVTLSKELNYKEGLSGAYNRLGILYKTKGLLDEATTYYKKSIEIAEEIGDKGLIADVTNNLGNIYRLNGKPLKATEAFISALKLRETTNDTNGAAAAYSNLSYIYSDQKNYLLAKENCQKAIDLYTIVADSFELGRSYGYMGFINYFDNSFDSAIHYCSIGLSIFKSLGDKSESSSLLNNMGNILTESGSALKSIPYHKDALAIQRDIKDSIGIYTSNLSLAQSYLYLNQLNQAEKYALSALGILKSIGGSRPMYRDGYLLLSQIYKAQNNYKDAYQYLELNKRYENSIVNESNSRTITEMQEKYESDKKNILLEKKSLEINNANYKIKQKNILTTGLIALIVVILLLTYLLYNRYKLRKDKEFQEEIIRQQQLRSKAIIDAEEKERVRIAKDLHDGIGQQLSATKLMVNALDKDDTLSSQEDKVHILLQTLDNSIKEVRTVSHNMMPNALFKLGLSSAIKEFINQISATGLLKVELHIIDLKTDLDKTTEIILYRVIQELVNNIIKHAKANTLSVQIIEHDNESLNIIIEDDGVGFDVKEAKAKSGIGLKNIISRIEYLNGIVDFDSTLGRGTTVIIDLPI